MKKLRNFFLTFNLILILILIPVNLFSQEYKIETSRGEQTVQIPEGFTVEEAFLEMASLYLEERFDHENLIKATEDLEILLNEYIEDNFRLANSLLEHQNKSQAIIKTYESTAFKKRIVSPIFGVHIDTELKFRFDVGVELFELIQINGIYEYPKSFGVRLGFRL